MSNIDKQALRINAQLASSGKWIKESGDGWEAICSSDDQANAGFIVAHFEGPDAKENREFIQAANPATVLALLDELEAKDGRIAELEVREVTLPVNITSANAPEVFEIAAEAERLGLRGTYASYAVGWNDRGMADKEALREAGVNVAAAGKGE
ncbi:TPA: ead/Ea22-like family protein [Enterobacter hormaechei]